MARESPPPFIANAIKNFHIFNPPLILTQYYQVPTIAVLTQYTPCTIEPTGSSDPFP